MKMKFQPKLSGSHLENGRNLSYNARLSSMRATLAALGGVGNGRHKRQIRKHNSIGESFLSHHSLHSARRNDLEKDVTPELVDAVKRFSIHPTRSNSIPSSGSTSDLPEIRIEDVCVQIHAGYSHLAAQGKNEVHVQGSSEGSTIGEDERNAELKRTMVWYMTY